MKRICAFLMCILIFLGLVGCNNDPTNQDTPATVETGTENTEPSSMPPEHQELTASQTPFDKDNMLRISIDEVGLKDLFVREMSDVCRIDEDVWGQVYLLGDDKRYGGGRGVSDHYLAIATGDIIIVEDIYKSKNLACYSGNIELRDFDGDGNNEILLHECVGMNGGAGSYLSRVFDYDNGKIIEIFSSENESHERIDTGYSITILENRQFKIENKFTQYSDIFSLQNRSEEYYEFWYDEDGKPWPLTIMVDSFYEFSPIDIDQDGVCEIACRQYVSLIGHFDGIGAAKTILKYNSATSEFEIYRTEFETYE